MSDNIEFESFPKMPRLNLEAEPKNMKKISIQSDVTGRELQKHTVRTHKQVGSILGISAERVRVIERRALEKCRRKLMFIQAQRLSHQ